MNVDDGKCSLCDVEKKIVADVGKHWFLCSSCCDVLREYFVGYDYFQKRLDATYEVLQREFGVSKTLDISYMVDSFLGED